MIEINSRKRWAQALFLSFSRSLENAMNKMEELGTAFGILKPLIIEGASAQLAGAGSIIVVHYRTSRPLIEKSRNILPYILDQESGKRLNVQRVPYIGNLSSRSVSSKPSKRGYFVIDNSDSAVGPDSKVTVVIGEMKKENVAVRG